MVGRAAKFGWFRQRPLAVAQETGRNQWTADDARRPEVIEKIAHNDLEVERMTKENPAIYRRQLVYRKDTAAATVERARATGESVQKLTLPGLDGQEYEFEVAQANIAPSGLSGTFAGHLPGRAQSVVTLAYKLDREAFTIVSSEDGVFLTAEAREPREVVVKRINPKLYAYFKCTTGVPAGTQAANCCGDQ